MWLLHVPVKKMDFGLVILQGWVEVCVQRSFEHSKSILLFAQHLARFLPTP